ITILPDVTLGKIYRVTRANFNSGRLTQPIPNGTVTRTPTGAAITNHFVVAGVFSDTIDPDAKMSYINEVVAGVEREVMPHTTLGVRYIRRNIARVLEDVANVPMVAYDLGVPGVSSVEYILTNPSSSTPIL